MKDFFKGKFNIIGKNKINIKNVIEDWKRISHLWSIFQNKKEKKMMKFFKKDISEYTLLRYKRKNSNIRFLKIGISIKEAQFLIKKLNLISYKSNLFRHYSTWKTSSLENEYKYLLSFISKVSTDSSIRTMVKRRDYNSKKMMKFLYLEEEEFFIKLQKSIDKKLKLVDFLIKRECK